MTASGWTRRLTTCCAAAVVVFACSQSGSPPPSPGPAPGPSAPTDPEPAPAIPRLGGDWVGTIESTTFGPRAVSARLFQAGVDCIDGAWRTEPSAWNGAISGYARADSFSGFIGFEGGLSGAGVCPAVSEVSGPSSDTQLTWTFASAGACAGGTAQVITLKLHR